MSNDVVNFIFIFFNVSATYIFLCLKFFFCLLCCSGAFDGKIFIRHAGASSAQKLMYV